MKIIKFKKREKFKYKRKVIIKDLTLNIFVGIHNFEKKKKQRVKFNIEILTDPYVSPNSKDLNSILNYEEVVIKIEKLTNSTHHELLEDLAENIFNIIFKNKLVKKINLKLEKMPEVICEPGRALVAESGSTIVKVNLRKKQKLYINDGTYGTLFDAGTPNIVFPSRMIKENSNKIISKKLTAFDFFGPTCDSMDYMKGPFLLPNNIKENDYIELGQLGAYGLTFRTQFNGYYSNEIYEVEDNPIMTMYDKDINKANMVA